MPIADSTYEEKLTRYARKLWEAAHPGLTLSGATARIEADSGNGGCPTCGWGDGAGIKLYLGNELVKEWDFYQIDEPLREILEA